MPSAPREHTQATFRPLLKSLVLSLGAPASAGAAAAAASTSPSANGAPSTASSSAHTRPVPPRPGRDEVEKILSHLSDVSFTANAENHAMLGAALTALRISGLDCQASTLADAARLFLCRAVDLGSSVDRVDAGEQQEAEYDGYVDLVGTGGDGQDTFNVSTTAAIVAAGVPGVRVAKHGARASSSTSGSADLLISLGIPLTSLSPSQLGPLLPQLSFTFLFAPLYHPSLGPLASIRRSLGFPTLFNVLGPLINPVKPRRCILGVHSPHLGNVFAEALRERGTERAWVVCGREGLDEISPEGETDVWELRHKEIKHFVISPASFGLPSHPLKHVNSHSAAENAAIVLKMLRSKEAREDVKQSEELLLLPSEPLSCALELSAVETAPIQGLPAIPCGTRLKAVEDYTLLQASALLYVAGCADKLGSCQVISSELAPDVPSASQQASSSSGSSGGGGGGGGKQQDASAEATRRRVDEYSYAPERTADVSVGTDD
ncbi:anthranilate phosphoribosyltransferase [Ceraceosorus bombacis]|uniref:Anthranilate phosphoribosyltransferase n=1 Tax=Ceraceosorus bombacis TaxID=401625 RepID=A0A0N7LB13_9BASI|nr:anthranilate phosphoribosyltransferase [Ceraceosorus bombacis]